MKLILFSFLAFSFSAKANDCAKDPIVKALADLNCSNKRAHLTFDDGPDKSVTPRLSKELKKRNVQGTFYVSTSNLKEGEKSQVLADLLADGHILGSHGHSHNAHDLRLLKTEGGYLCDPSSLTAEESKKEIEKSFALLDQATAGNFSKQKNRLFRFPYGRGASPSPVEMQIMKTKGKLRPGERIEGEIAKDADYKNDLAEYRKFRSEALQRVHSFGADHIGWNYDSRDSSTEVATRATKDPEWFAQKVVKELCSSPQNSIVALFHDRGKPFAPKAIGRIIDAGRCLGANFVSYEDLLSEKDFLVNTGVIQESPKLDNAPTEWAIRNIASAVSPSLDAPSCEAKNGKALTCLSENGKTYGHCEGEDSICVHGVWKSKRDEAVEKACRKKCYSEYAKRYFSHCEGEDSICVNGLWESKDSQKAINACHSR